MPYKDPEQIRAYQREWCKKPKVKDKRLGRARRLKMERREYCARIALERGCIVCGYKECADALDFHHVDPKKKTERVSKLVGDLASYDKIDEEISKCVVICANHHRELHAGMIELPV